ncbi:hypothetical protein G7062_09795 [Erysipelothrix sp. HDW6C]|uniref:CDP-alcohol phosphatidyltransferase family protein n=1 Tax=Erysipelothrix sp. HDW6C TaxID=2714930 RepID=UPI00140E2B2A|nr:CDP-alcohol phosphatidyltransferase family protein [Erysipelothrix sp. HDW6C]QIK70576.1 hypothetical protein G7062_09795 [Erysipelothrix sp. HDW6C]
MIRKIPNILSLFRIVLVFIVCFLPINSTYFLPLYLFMGSTDILDGFIARKFNAHSELGAALDSIADFFMYLLIATILIPTLTLPQQYIFLSIILFTRLIAITIGYVRFKTLVFIHTLANKASGLLVFFLPILTQAHFYLLALTICCIVALIAALEELVIIATTSKLNRDQKSLLM